jgi:hypothetical protein
VFNGCSISSNACSVSGGGVAISSGNQSFYNCTVSQNSAVSGAGGIAGAGTTLLRHCTVVSNTGPQGITAGASFNADNSILADCNGTLVSGGYNLIQNTAGCTITGNSTGNLYNVNPVLGPLQNNSGPTRTHALLPGSPAIDAGTSAGLLADQRGFTRPFDVPATPNVADASDIGAFEFTADPTALVVVNNHDSGPGSLRQAVLAASGLTNAEITFQNVTSPIVLASSLQSLWGNTIITGPGTNLLVVSGSNQCRVLSIRSGATVAISGLAIADGSAQADSSFVGTYGCGISNGGSLKLLNCVVRNCNPNDTSSANYGLGIYNSGSLDMEGCIVADCQTSPYADVYGAGVYNLGTLRVNGCAFLRCDAYVFGGAMDNEGDLSMSNSVVEDCMAVHQGDGGGIGNGGTAVLNCCLITNCSGWDGAGISSDGTLLMTNSAVIACNSAGYGGGLLVSGTAVLSGCTISGNDAVRGGAISSYGELTLLNCTLSENSAQTGGGALGGNWANSYGTSFLNHCTVVFNATNSILAGPAFHSQNSILADCNGTLIGGGYNLIQDLTGCTNSGKSTGNIYGADPFLGPLQNNGGPTQTHALLPGSPAIDAGSSGGLATDQRGFPRTFDVPGWPNAADGSDMGAFELACAFPGFDQAARLWGTNFSLQFVAEPGQICTLEASTNLVNWVELASSIMGPNGLWDLIDQDAYKYPKRFYRAVVASGLAAISGVVTSPFLINGDYIYQPVETTDPASGGRAAYTFFISSAGPYMIQTTVDAPSDAANSLFVNVDAEPQAPAMIWDILPYTTGFEQRAVSWRGNGTFDHNQFVPKVFTLSQGSHQLIIRGREANVRLRTIGIVPYPAIYLPASSGTVAPPFVLANGAVSQPIETLVPTNGGRAEFSFFVPNTGTYVLQATVNAPSDSANSFFVNIDAEPQDPAMIWDIFPFTVGFDQRVVSWRGSGTDVNNQFVPEVFSLTSGAHLLIIRGREANAALRDVALLPYP